VFKNFVLTFSCLITVSLSAQEPQVAALTFQGWKDQQSLDAQNQVLRVSARISQLRTEKPAAQSSKEAAAPLPNSKIKKSEVDSLAAAERDLRRV